MVHFKKWREVQPPGQWNIAKKDSKWLLVKVNGQTVADSIDNVYNKLNDEDIVDAYDVPLAGYIALGNMIGIIIFSIMTAI